MALTFNMRGQVVSIARFVAELEEILPTAKGLIQHGGDPIPVAVDYDDSELRAFLPEVPNTPLRQGIEETLEGFKRASNKRASWISPTWSSRPSRPTRRALGLYTQTLIELRGHGIASTRPGPGRKSIPGPTGDPNESSRSLTQISGPTSKHPEAPRR